MQLLAGLGPLGLPELAIILVIVVLIFGVGRLPEIGGAVGKGIREFRQATKDDETKDADTTTMNSVAPPPVAAPPADMTATSGAGSVAASADTIFCSECGARNSRSAKFCAECGRAIAAQVS